MFGEGRDEGVYLPANHGATSVTLIPECWSSIDIERNNPMTPCFAAEYSGAIGSPLIEAGAQSVRCQEKRDVRTNVPTEPMRTSAFSDFESLFLRR